MATNSALLADLAAGILGGGIRVVDLTVPLEPATPTIQLPPQFAPSKPFVLEEISRYDQRGPAWYWNNIACGEHTGTHFDAPIHWVTGKDYPNNATHNIPVQKFIGPACVIDVTERVRENVDFLVTVESGEGLGAEARRDSARRLGADPHGLVEAHRRAELPQHLVKTGRTPPASIRNACRSWRRSATSSASASRPSARMQARRRPSTRCSRVTRSCTAPTASASPA